MFLADTNLLSESQQLQPEQKVLDWISANEDQLFLSAISIAEIRAGISALDSGRKRAKLAAWFDAVREQYRDSILAFDEATALRWGDLNAELRRKGRNLPLEDSYLAATALQHDLVLVTRNEKDFSGSGVTVFNPWKSESD